MLAGVVPAASASAYKKPQLLKRRQPQRRRRNPRVFAKQKPSVFLRSSTAALTTAAGRLTLAASVFT
jgi:hypothetical protein